MSLAGDKEFKCKNQSQHHRKTKTKDGKQNGNLLRKRDLHRAETYPQIVRRWVFIKHLDGLVQERCNSIAKALELHLSCTNPLIYCLPLNTWSSKWEISLFKSANILQPNNNFLTEKDEFGRLHFTVFDTKMQIFFKNPANNEQEILTNTEKASFQYQYLAWTLWILTTPYGVIEHETTLVQVMACCLMAPCH